MKRSTINAQSGFTLVEIAIVLVIIGLLLGGVLKGTELIENSKVKRAVGELQGVATAYHSYIDRYGRMPGDDGQLATLQARGDAWADITRAGNNNGVLSVTLDQTFNGGGESTGFWQHLRAAGYIKGDVTLQFSQSPPSNAFNGRVGVTTAPMGNGLKGVKACLSRVPGKAAIALDNQLDDGMGQKGSVRATLGTEGENTIPDTNALAAEYSEAEEYTVCLKI